MVTVTCYYLAQAEPMHTTVEKALLGRLELIQGPCNGTGENEPSFKIVRTVTSGGIPRCYNWGLFREGRFSQPPSCELSPVVISHARRREGFAVAEHGYTAQGAKIACERYRRIGRTIPNGDILVCKPNGNWIALDSLARTS